VALGLLLLALFVGTLARAAEELLDPEQAFALTVTAQDDDTLLAQWNIAPGYYLYRERLRFESVTPGIDLGEARSPPGKLKEDEFFGKMETYRNSVAIEIPLLRGANAPNRLELKTTSQGCADSGVCYPPYTQTVAVTLPATSSAPAGADLLSRLTSPANQLGLGPAQDELLDPEQAFILSVTVPDPTTLVATWTIAPGYYLYRDKLQLELIDAEGVAITAVDIPPGEPKEDEFFGLQEVFYDQAVATARLRRDRPEAGDLLVQASYQGCAELGVCYPPLSERIPITLPVLAAAAASPAAAAVEPPPGPAVGSEPPVSEQDMIAGMLVEQRFLALPAFFGFGLLLAFTPCIFPMIPILSSIIVGQGEALTRWQAFMLSLIYVLAMAITYTIAGVLAALLGSNIQALFQNPWVLGGFSAVFVALALSMFGFYDLQLPSRWQSRLTEISNRQSGGNYVGVAIMGLLSALIVGPCVAAPLIGVLTVIATTGDAVLGGAALFIMSLGMGAPLLAIGASAGTLLPRAGHWMDTIKSVFGVLLLGVAIWLLERILPAALSMLAWAVLLIVSATYLGTLQPVSRDSPGWRPLVKGLGMVLMIYGVLLLVGIAAGGRDPLQPLRGVGLMAAGETAQDQAAFKPIKTVADLEQEISAAGGRAVILDFYADWCVSCKELEKYTFTDPEVQAAWSDAVLLKADVTANDTADQALLRHFGVIGPPAILFFGSDGVERPNYRVVGFMPADTFKAHVESALRS